MKNFFVLCLLLFVCLFADAQNKTKISVPAGLVTGQLVSGGIYDSLTTISIPRFDTSQVVFVTIDTSTAVYTQYNIIYQKDSSTLNSQDVRRVVDDKVHWVMGYQIVDKKAGPFDERFVDNKFRPIPKNELIIWWNRTYQIFYRN